MASLRASANEMLTDAAAFARAGFARDGVARDGVARDGVARDGVARGEAARGEAARGEAARAGFARDEAARDGIGGEVRGTKADCTKGLRLGAPPRWAAWPGQCGQCRANWRPRDGFAMGMSA